MRNCWRRKTLNNPETDVSHGQGEGATVENAAATPDITSKAAPGAERTCLVTRQSQPRWGLIRFCRAPDGLIVADLAEKLPGRGAWVSADRDSLLTARRKQVFARAFRNGDCRFAAEADRWLEELAAMLQDRCVKLLGLARRSGQLATGFEAASAGLKSAGPRDVLVIAAGTRTDSAAKLERLAGHRNVPVCRVFSVEALSPALGLDAVRYLVLPERAGAEKFLRDALRYQGVVGR